MILRRWAAAGKGSWRPEDGRASRRARGVDEWTGRTPLRWHLAVLTFAVVTFAVGLTTFFTYLTISRTLTASVDRDLEQLGGVLLGRTLDPLHLTDLEGEIERFRTYNPETRVSLLPPGWTFASGDAIPVVGNLQTTGETVRTAFRTVSGERVMSKTDALGTTVVLARDMGETHVLVSSLGAVLLFIAGLGIVLAIAAGLVVASTGLTPLQRLQRAVDYVADTDDLRPIAVEGNDEVAQLTRSFNTMLGVLQESRTRQAQLVADAGHELKTPLTSMRTNIELLMMLHQPGAAGRISVEDRQDLERDVMAQLAELSTLIGDLVDLAREDAAETVMETVDLQEVLVSSLERVRRRRPDIDFDVHTVPWSLLGDQFSLGRAAVNLLDNAAKWSPREGVVRVRMTPLADARVELTVADSGPGIRPEDRERVFERFYRAPESRSQPGSGLGLAIVKQTVVRHGGSIRIAGSADGGALAVVELPGLPQFTPSR